MKELRGAAVVDRVTSEWLVDFILCYSRQPLEKERVSAPWIWMATEGGWGGGGWTCGVS